MDFGAILGSPFPSVKVIPPGGEGSTPPELVPIYREAVGHTHTSRVTRQCLPNVGAQRAAPCPGVSGLLILADQPRLSPPKLVPTCQDGGGPAPGDSRIDAL